MDLDVGLAVALLDQGRYRTITERLRKAGFTQDVNEEGNPTRQRWKIERAAIVAVDLFYVVRNFGAGVASVVENLRPLLVDRAAADAIAVLRRDFVDHEGIGPRRVAEFQTGRPDDVIQADVVGFVRQLLERCG